MNFLESDQSAKQFIETRLLEKTGLWTQDSQTRIFMPIIESMINMLLPTLTRNKYKSIEVTDYFFRKSITSDELASVLVLTPNEFLLGYNYDEIGDLDDLLRITAHEIIHIAQYLNGDLSFDTNSKRTSIVYWKGEEYDYDKTPYRNRPWEIEAYANSTKYYVQYLKSPAYKKLMTELVDTVIKNGHKKSTDQTVNGLPFLMLRDWLNPQYAVKMDRIQKAVDDLIKDKK